MSASISKSAASLAAAVAIALAITTPCPSAFAAEPKDPENRERVKDSPPPGPDLASVSNMTPDGALGEPGLDATDFRKDTPKPEDLEAIVARIKERGTARVVLGLALEFVPEGLLAEDGVEEQRKRIAIAQERLLGSLEGVEAVVHLYETIPYVAVVMTARGIDSLARAELLASARLDRENFASLSRTTPLIGATTALSRGFSGAGQTVAILDTGVDSAHPFLAATVVDEACFGSCPNGSGRQFGFGAGVPLPAVIAGFDHGTHVAGIVAGRATANAAFNGVAPGANIMAINVFHRVDNFLFFNDCGASPSPCASAFDSDVIAGLERVFNRRGLFSIASVNLSLGSGGFASHCDSSPFKPAIDNLRSVGIATVAAAGNGGLRGVSEPACVSGVVSVGATSTSDVVPFFSNSASFLSLLAPGVNVSSSVPGGLFAMKSGTSMAAPHVAGSFALLKQRFPRARAFTLLSALQQSGLRVTDFGSGVTTPRIRVARALASPAVFNHDFTRDRAADVAIWRPSTGEWWIVGEPTVLWGVAGDIPVAGDYNGDGTTEIAVWRPSTGQWWIRNPSTIVWGRAVPVWGWAGDVPVPADYDGNGTTDIAIWRPSTGEWWIRGQSTTLWGQPGDIPVPADYDGDGKADIAIWRPSTGEWFVRGQFTVQWGQPGDIPVPADYDGDGKADIAIWRPSTGEWMVRGQFLQQWGTSGDVPIARDLGAGRAELTVWRPGTGEWLTLIRFFTGALTAPTTVWGGVGDVPL